MSANRMFGVVLWCDKTDSKAVIWCEDHGNLAFYTPTQHSIHDGMSLDPGDLIEFDMSEDKNLRYARNPEVVVQDHSRALADSLGRAQAIAGQFCPSEIPLPDVTANSDNVIPLHAQTAEEPLIAAG